MGDLAGTDPSPAVSIPAVVLERFEAFSLYNSPYPAHDTGCAIDLYPGGGRDAPAPSPVAGTVTDVRTVRAPPRAYAADDDHLIVVETGDRLARILHVDPTVEPGDEVAVGDPLGSLVRSGYFAPWVDNHVHLGFRPPDGDPLRATGSLPVVPTVDVAAIPWDGTGTVVETADTFVRLDTPAHPNPGETFASVAAGRRTADGALDGGLPHYDGGGRLGGTPDGPGVAVAGRRVGTATGRTVAWADVEIRANGTPVTGLSFAPMRDRLGVKIVSWDGIPATVGDHVRVTIEPTD